tara:strand:+ start:3902 stop:4543 length:642 start_codon:yes stop_codon:yes gene_type:complete
MRTNISGGVTRHLNVTNIDAVSGKEPHNNEASITYIVRGEGECSSMVRFEWNSYDTEYIQADEFETLPDDNRWGWRPPSGSLRGRNVNRQKECLTIAFFRGRQWGWTTDPSGEYGYGTHDTVFSGTKSQVIRDGLISMTSMLVESQVIPSGLIHCAEGRNALERLMEEAIDMYGGERFCDMTGRTVWTSLDIKESIEYSMDSRRPSHPESDAV